MLFIDIIFIFENKQRVNLCRHLFDIVSKLVYQGFATNIAVAEKNINAYKIIVTYIFTTIRINILKIRYSNNA